MLKKAATISAMLVLITLLAAPWVLAQDAYQPQEIESQPLQILPPSTPIATDDAGLQYSSEIPPGYQVAPGGRVACPTNDPHGPPCILLR